MLFRSDVGATPNTAYVVAGTGLSGGGRLTGNVTLNIANTAVTSGTYGNASYVSQVTINSQGQITNAANVGIVVSVANVTGAVPNTVNVIAGTGLTGGGDLTANRTLSLANISTNYIMANMSGITAPPTPNTITQILDQTIASAQGDRKSTRLNSSHT